MLQASSREGQAISRRDGHERSLAFQPAAKYAPIMDAVYKSLMDRSATKTCRHHGHDVTCGPVQCKAHLQNTIIQTKGRIQTADVPSVSAELSSMSEGSLLLNLTPCVCQRSIICMAVLYHTKGTSCI